MFLRMIDGLVRFVIVNGSVVFMMVMNALIVLQLVNERGRADYRRQATLHGETIQGQAKQQEDVDNSAQEVTKQISRNYSSCLCCQRQDMFQFACIDKLNTFKKNKVLHGCVDKRRQ